jgi:hypothetical protein
MRAARMLEYTSERVLTQACKTIDTRTTKKLQYTRSMIDSPLERHQGKRKLHPTNGDRRGVLELPPQLFRGK